MLIATLINPVIAIDGTAGSGKSTVARKVANKLHFVHLNSGLLYRSLGLTAKRQGVSLNDESALVRILAGLRMSYQLEPSGSTEFRVNGEPVERELIGMEVGELASRVSLHPTVREVVTEIQREHGKLFPLVLEGRDAGTVVFPDTKFKFFLTASPEVRASRCLSDADKAEGLQDLQVMLEKLKARDARDINRSVAPTVKADDAYLIDTSSLTVEQVVDEVERVFRQKREKEIA